MTSSVQFIDTPAADVRPIGPAKPLVVLKFGSSVLKDPGDLPDVVSEIYRYVRAGRRVIAVVSAFEGVTDSLLQECSEAGAVHDNVNAPAYVALGEETSAAMLALACDRAGLCAIAFKTGDIGLIAEGDPFDASPVALRGKRLERAFELNDVVVVPGFVATSARDGRTLLLGRGGSDLTAIYLGEKLGAERVRLVKDVDGVYEADPALRQTARRFARVEWARAREVAGQLVQLKAIDFAAARHLSVEVSALGLDDATIIDGDGNIPALPRSRRRLRVALAGLGVVGGGVAQRLAQLESRYELVGALVRVPEKVRDFDWSGIPLTLEPDELLSFKPDVIVDVLSDGALGAQLSEAALRAGVHVVSANKQAVASAYQRLHEAARASGATFAYSAAVGGSAPILEAVAQACAAETDIHTIEGVLNGTVNFVLGLLAQGVSLSDALGAARRAGLAEEDPSFDLDGHDAAAKLKLIALEAFGEPLAKDQLHVESLSASVASLAHRVSLKQVSRLTQRGGVVRGEIVFEPAHHGPFAQMGGDRNAVIVKGDDGRQWTARGRGAGRWPTTESLLADLAGLSSPS